MPVTICQPGRLADRAAELEAAGQVITSVNQLNDGTVAIVTIWRSWPPAVETRTSKEAHA
jgi:hypothetical protein